MIPARAAWLVRRWQWPSRRSCRPCARGSRPTRPGWPSRPQADYAAGHYDRAEAGLARLAACPPTPINRMARALVARGADEAEELGIG